jgi:hypothetical protein
MTSPIPAVPTVVHVGRLVLVELADGWALEVLALEYVTTARVLCEGREVRRVEVARA